MKYTIRCSGIYNFAEKNTRCRQKYIDSMSELPGEAGTGRDIC